MDVDEENIGPGSKVGPLAFTGDSIEIGQLLGQGATANVYACRRVRTGDELAVKVIDIRRMRRLDDCAQALRRLEIEVQALREATHERCLGLTDIYRSSRWVCLVMERLQGGELFDHIIAKKRLSEPEARYVFRQLCEGLAFLHSRRIAHRDVKPENILIAGSREAPASEGGGVRLDIKLADYGLSKLMGSGSEAKSLVGTPQYWAPEVLASGGANAYDQRADLWSLGVTLYVMLRGQYPFKGERANEMIRNGEFDVSSGVWQSVSEDAKDLIRKLLKVDPEARLPLDRCLLHPWITGRPESSPSQSTSSSAPPLFSSVDRPASAEVQHTNNTTALVKWDNTARLQVEGEGQSEGFSLQELVNLQVSVTASLEAACLACRHSHPHLSADISTALHHTSALWQKASAVIRQYAQVANDVRNKVLPDLELAVQESEPNLAVELLEVVHGWTSQMRADGDAAQRLCADLGERLCGLIAKAQGAAAAAVASASAAPTTPTLPAPPRAQSVSSAVAEQILSGDADVTQHAAASSAKAALGGVNVATQKLLEGLAGFTESMRLTSDAKGAERECEQRRDLIDLLFLAPGARAAGLGRGLAAIEAEQVVDHAMSDAGGSPRPASSVVTEATPAGSAVGGGGATLATREGLDGQWDLAHPLLKALRELRRVSQILLECMSFWTNMDGTVQELGRLKDHTASLVKYASKSSSLRARFDSRLAEYSDFWGSLMRLCERYCSEVEPALQKVRALIAKVEDAADTIDAAGRFAPAARIVPMRD